MLRRIILVLVALPLFITGCQSGETAPNSPAVSKAVTASSEASSPMSTASVAIKETGEKSVGSRYVQIYEDKVYYTDNKYLYVMNEDGSEYRRIAQLFRNSDDRYADYTWRDVHIYNDRIYYGNTAQNKIYTMSLNGGDKRVLCEGKLLDVAYGRIFYSRYTEDEAHLMSMDLNGKNRRLLDNIDPDPYDFTIHDGWLYYTTNGISSGITRIRYDGKYKRVITEVTSNFYVDGNLLAYSVGDDMVKIFCMDLNTSEKKLLYSYDNTDIREIVEKTLPGCSIGYFPVMAGIKGEYVYFYREYLPNCFMLLKQKTSINDTPVLVAVFQGRAYIDWENDKLYYATDYNSQINEPNIGNVLGLTRTDPFIYSFSFVDNEFTVISEKGLEGGYDFFAYEDYLYFDAFDATDKEGNAWLYRYNTKTKTITKLKSETLLFPESEGE